MLTASIVIGCLYQCKSDNDGVYTRLRNHADGIKVINTHEHQRLPEAYGDYDFGFYHLMAASYLSADVTSAGADAGNWELIEDLPGPDERYTQAVFTGETLYCNLSDPSHINALQVPDLIPWMSHPNKPEDGSNA